VSEPVGPDRVPDLPHAGSLRVLVVEDDDRNAALVGLSLELSGIPFERARSVEEAREHLERGLPDAILLDLRLPGLPGHALTREVRAAPGGSGVHILAVSASVLEADRREALESGADGFVDKPISPRDVVARILHGVAARRARVAPR
jgi:two-component system, cell cycle response regulator DivK